MTEMEEILRDSKDSSDHDMLVEMRTALKFIWIGHTNHLEHHRRRDLTMLGVCLGSILTSFTAIVCAILALKGSGV